MFLTVESTEETLNAPKEKRLLFIKSSSEVVCEDKAPERERNCKSWGLPNVYTFQPTYLHCPLGDNQHTIPSQQDYTDKIELNGFLHSSNRGLFTESQTF